MLVPACSRAAVLMLTGLTLALPACSVRKLALSSTADALAASGGTYARDDDPELIREAAPFSLKAMEGVLAETPDHVGLLTATARGFTQYSYAFVQQDGEELEATDIKRATQAFARAQRLYRRGRDYGLRGLEVSHPGFSAQLRADPRAAASVARQEDVALLYWTAAAWAALIGVSKDDPQAISEVPAMEALIDRAVALDEAWDAGAIHTFLITYEPARQGVRGDALARAQAHFDRAVELSHGQQAAPYVALAETVAVSRQDRAQFQALLGQALAVDVNAEPDRRLANLVMQRRARWLLSRTDELIVD